MESGEISSREDGIPPAKDTLTAENEAFQQAILNWKKPLSLPVERAVPKRLFNIHTGVLEAGTRDKKYVILSYIWDPSSLPDYPRLERREDRDDSWEYTTESFDEVVRLATEESWIEESSTRGSEKYLVTVDPEFESKASKLARPEFTCATTPAQAAYFRGVCSLACVEAADRGLSYVWMDSLCINQSDPMDIAEQIPQMADYFHEAEVCVVASEMLRRRLAHRIERLGADVLNARYNTPWDLPYENSPRPSEDIAREIQEKVQAFNGYSWESVENIYGVGKASTYYETAVEGIHPKIGKVAGLDEEERCYRAKWGMADEIAGWLISFHEFRVWTFQETCLAREVIHRGLNIRVRTAAALVIAEYWTEYNAIEIELLPIQYLPMHQKIFRLLHLHREYLRRLQRRMPLPFRQVGMEVAGHGSDEPKWSAMQCLSIIREQLRSSAYDQDAVYGALGIFPPSVRHTLPISYSISCSAVFALLVYVLVCNGDPLALFVDEDIDATEHVISNAPSWMPRRSGEFVACWPEMEQPYSDEGLQMQVDGRRLMLTAPSLDVIDCTSLVVGDSLSKEVPPGEFWIEPRNEVLQVVNMARQVGAPLHEIFSFLPPDFEVPRDGSLSKFYLRERGGRIPSADEIEIGAAPQPTIEQCAVRERIRKATKAGKLAVVYVVRAASRNKRQLWLLLESVVDKDTEENVWKKIGVAESEISVPWPRFESKTFHII